MHDRVTERKLKPRAGSATTLLQRYMFAAQVTEASGDSNSRGLLRHAQRYSSQKQPA